MGQIVQSVATLFDISALDWEGNRKHKGESGYVKSTIGALMVMGAVTATIPASAQAATVINSGSYINGDFVQVSGSTSLGPGRYQFTVDTSAPVNFFYGYVEKQISSNFYCTDPGIPGGEFYCGGNDVPFGYDFMPVTPTRYQATVTVNAPTTTLFPGSFTSRIEDSESCCSYYFDFDAPSDGRFALSVSAIPEPASWALMILGFGAVGAAMRRRERAVLRPARANI